MANKRICMVCQKAYSYCPTCYEFKFKPAWYAMFDSEACHDVWSVILDHDAERISDEEAVELIEALDLGQMEGYDANVKKSVQDILNTKKSKKVD